MKVKKDMAVDQATLPNLPQGDMSAPPRGQVEVLDTSSRIPQIKPEYLLWRGDVEHFLTRLPPQPLFDLVVTSPPYNLGKAYEKSVELEDYISWQERVIDTILPRLKPTGSLCWQVGNFVPQAGRGTEHSSIYPLDYLFHPLFAKRGLLLRNRIIWRFGHGLHSKRRFSGRYEVVLWYTVSEEYTFNLDAVRVPSKYPGKRAYKGPKAGLVSSNPLGKNPEDIWEIPNVKSNHPEKTSHPCQFPVGLIERLVLALTNPGDLVFDPFAGAGSAGVAAAVHGRRFWGCETVDEYVTISQQRLLAALEGNARYRPHDKPIYDHTKSKLSLRPVDGALGEEKRVTDEGDSVWA